MEIGKTYVFFVPPGWLLGGTIIGLDDKVITLKDAVYLEHVSEGAMIGDGAFAQTAKELTSVVKTSHGIPDNTELRREACLLVVPCARDMTPLSRQKDANTLKGVK